ncbi:MAG: malto-oligosyltrehalose trehalohydrolase [Cyclobacteriaceae bacterium]
MDQNITKAVGVEKKSDLSYSLTVWAPNAKRVQLKIKGQANLQDLNKDAYGYWEKTIEGLTAGSRYMFLLDSELLRPDPASRSQPEGVHSWSEVIDQTDFRWTDHQWQSKSLSETIIYELHVGTFTSEGTFDAILDQLDHLKQLGVNAIEIMPISQFPGSRNWGYDGVYPFAVQESYGDVTNLKHFVDICHQQGIAVILDVVYNHMGPEGNYLADFGPYFTEKYHTPWGAALNFDDGYSDHVRNFFLQNAIMWLKDFHFDGLRLDAIHAILDNGPIQLLKALRMKVDQLEKETGKPYYLIAESDMNDVKIISDYSKGGYGLQAQWTDDFHHSVHAILTGESNGYYEDYGGLKHLAKAFSQGFVYDGVYSPYRKRLIGTDPADMEKHSFVVCLQNHDQVGNRMMGDRLSTLISFEALKLGAGLLLTSPFVPMLFMGEEYGEENPFQYFVSHGEPDLVKAVQNGRKKEFESFQWQGDVPDPQAETTFLQSKLNWDYKDDFKKATLFKFYQQLISLRKAGTFSAYKQKKLQIAINEQDKLLTLSVEKDSSGIWGVYNCGKKDLETTAPEVSGIWMKKIGSSDLSWLGPNDAADELPGQETIVISASSFVIYQNYSKK